MTTKGPRVAAAVLAGGNVRVALEDDPWFDKGAPDMRAPNQPA